MIPTHCPRICTHPRAHTTYTPQLDVPLPLAGALLAAADQYLLAGLKDICQDAIAQVKRVAFTWQNTGLPPLPKDDS